VQHYPYYQTLRAFSKKTYPRNGAAEMQSNYVFQLNHDRQPLDMVHPARGRKIQFAQKAAVIRTYPYVLIRAQQIENPVTKEYILKIDPGSKWTGFAIQCGDEIVYRMDLQHRGLAIKSGLEKRAAFRRGRRSRNLRYRKKRFDRHNPEGWLAPSLMHRVLTVETWIKRFMRYCPITCIEIEQVRFDMQLMQNPEVSGVAYQQGTLQGYEVRQYLLEKWGRKCAYCDAENVPLEIEHVQPRSKGGTDRVSNLTLACHDCNQSKGNQDIKDFLKGKTDLLSKIQAQLKTPLQDAAAVNATRFAIVRMAEDLCETVKCWTGGRTKFNRTQKGLEKSHSTDAACIGESGASIKILTDKPLIVICKGHGNRQARRVNASGFPAVKNAKEGRSHVRTGDIVRFHKPKDSLNKKGELTVPKGVHVVRVAGTTKKGFETRLLDTKITVPSMVGVEFVHKHDGYSYG
jgi:5-methylcytosine-specific restriction endonuclease McrA